jgi:nicotinamide riboside kinase
MLVERPHKVALVGPGGIGKSLLIDAIQPSFPEPKQLVTVPEAARDYFLAHRDIPEDNRFRLTHQGNIQSLARMREDAAHAQHPEKIITDRAVIDAVVYTKAHGDPEGAKVLWERAKPWVPTYDLFVMPDPEGVPFQQDDVRQEEESVRTRFFDEFVGFFIATGLPFGVLTGALEERIKTFEATLHKPSLPLHGSWRLGRDIVNHTGNSWNFIHDTTRD